MALAFKRAITITTILIVPAVFLPTAECLWRFPGSISRDISQAAEEDKFKHAMGQLLQHEAKCVPSNQEDILKELDTFMTSSATVSAVAEKVVELGKTKLCRFDFLECHKDSAVCACSNDAKWDEKTKTCRFRIGWPCTDGESKKPKQCVAAAACRPWQGSFSYDNEQFPKASKFFTDAGSFYCRCNEESECQGSADYQDLQRSGKEVKLPMAVARVTAATIVHALVLRFVLL